MSLELNIVSGTVSIPQEIENLEQLKSELAPKLEYYNNLVVTENSIKGAKSDKAKLNKLRTAVEERRKEIKKQVMGLYEPLENQCKELTALIDAPISAIDKQLKNFEEIKKQEKLNEITMFFEQINRLEFVKLEDVLNPKWGNATVKIDKLKTEISENVQRLYDDYSEIEKLYETSPMFMAIKHKFEETKDKAQTLAYATILEKQQQREKEIQEASTAKPEVIPEEPKATKATEPVEQAEETLLSGTFRIICTKHQLINLRDYMKSTGIRFEIVK